MSLKILYLSCHSVLEFDEVKMLHELGHKIFSPGAYVEPLNPGDATLRSSIDGLKYDKDVLEQFHRICAAHPGEDAKDYLTKEFIDNFDCVIVMHLPRWIERNWHAMKHKRVIWRTIGQSVASTEDSLRRYRAEGLEIIRYSPKEIHIPGFIGQDAMIRFYKDPDDYGPWNGCNERVITFAQHMKDRGNACSYHIFEEATRPYTRGLFGPGNTQESWMHGKVPYEQLKEEMNNNRVYFCTGTHPASYTLNFIEAWMSGIPVVAIGTELGNAHWCRNHQLYEVDTLISNTHNGFVSDDISMLKHYVKLMLENKAVAEFIGGNGREEAIKHFGKDHIWPAWQKYLTEGGR